MERFSSGICVYLAPRTGSLKDVLNMTPKIIHIYHICIYHIHIYIYIYIYIYICSLLGSSSNPACLGKASPMILKTARLGQGGGLPPPCVHQVMPHSASAGNTTHCNSQFFAAGLKAFCRDLSYPRVKQPQTVEQETGKRRDVLPSRAPEHCNIVDCCLKNSHLTVPRRQKDCSKVPSQHRPPPRAKPNAPTLHPLQTTVSSVIQCLSNKIRGIRETRWARREEPKI